MKAWISPIANSNIIYPIWHGRSRRNIGRFCIRRREMTYDPIKARTMCPALMLAASRNERVAGRTTVLIVSAKVRNGFSQAGAPSGRSAAMNEEMLFLADLMIKANHRGRPKVKVNRRCLDDGRTYGISPVQFVKIRRRKSGEMREVIPLIDLPNVRDI